MIGYGTAVVGVYCDTCNLTITIHGDAMSIHEVGDHEDGWEPDEWEHGPSYGPDPWG